MQAPHGCSGDAARVRAGHRSPDGELFAGSAVT